MSNDEREPSPVSPQEVGDAAVAFMDGLTDAFGAEATSELHVDGTELDVHVTGEGLGLLVGPGGRDAECDPGSRARVRSAASR